MANGAAVAVSADGEVKIKTVDLSLAYGPTLALNKINLDVRTREITALIGPSGCGKSSFLRSLNRMNDLVPSARVKGQVFFDGEDVYAPRTDVVELRRRVGMVFQRPNPFPMSIFDNVAYGLRIHGMRSRQLLQSRVEEVLRAAALWDEVKGKLRHSAMELSGGQQQRLCIARALAVGPEVLLMDEPASALDPISTAKVEELCGKLADAYTIVIVTHNLQQAARISARTAFFLNGELVEMGDTERMFTNPKDKRTEDYITGRFG